MGDPHEAPMNSLSIDGFGMSWLPPDYGPAMMPVYVRGEAHLAAREGLEAAAEFQKIIDQRGVVGECAPSAPSRILASAAPTRWRATLTEGPRWRIRTS